MMATGTTSCCRWIARPMRPRLTWTAWSWGCRTSLRWAALQTATLDDLGLWTRVLTPLEVAKVESAGRTGGNSFDSIAPPVTLRAIGSGPNVILSWATGTLLQSSNLG